MFWDEKTEMLVRLFLSLVGFVVWAGGCGGLMLASLVSSLPLHWRVFVCTVSVGFVVLGGALCVAVLLGFCDDQSVDCRPQRVVPSQKPLVRSVRSVPLWRSSRQCLLPAAAAVAQTEEPTVVMRPIQAYTPSPLAPEIPPTKVGSLYEFEGNV